MTRDEWKAWFIAMRDTTLDADVLDVVADMGEQVDMLQEVRYASWGGTLPWDFGETKHSRMCSCLGPCMGLLGCGQRSPSGVVSEGMVERAARAAAEWAHEAELMELDMALRCGDRKVMRLLLTAALNYKETPDV